MKIELKKQKHRLRKLYKKCGTRLTKKGKNLTKFLIALFNIGLSVTRNLQSHEHHAMLESGINYLLLQMLFLLFLLHSACYPLENNQIGNFIIFA